MEFSEYQTHVEVMPLYDDPILGLMGEVGEVVEHVKKARRPEPRTKLINTEEFAHELGDVLWYLTRLASEYNISMEKVAELNLQKLNKRHSND